MIETPRLFIRDWRDSDREPFAAMNADPAVREHLGPTQTRAETDAVIDRLVAVAADHGHTFWALERRDDARFLGFCGLKIAPENIPGIEGAIEIGWRLARDAWGAGYAREAAAACLDWGFANLFDDRIIAITTPANTRSWGLMLRLGMVRRHDLDFAHPALAADDPLSAHVTYERARP
ncbi:GNAT family N-acetyltransferase [Sandarakinorhabdus sp. DWP1-3-1]|uniref:GNAT family N-acetyltransferase n=1 Tax=Sandarakinorhabdus sp. DWP1-3-1 TaxID=2804627 RepID=UPI003CFA6F76